MHQISEENCQFYWEGMYVMEVERSKVVYYVGDLCGFFFAVGAGLPNAECWGCYPQSWIRVMPCYHDESLGYRVSGMLKFYLFFRFLLNLHETFSFSD